MTVRLVSVRAAAALVCLGLTAGPAFAEEARYEIDPGHTHIVFSVERFGFADTIGIFPDGGGELVLDPLAPQNSRVEAYVDTGSLWTGLASRDAAVAGPSWLNVETFPQIRFHSTRVTLIDENTATVTGDFELLGETRSITFNARLNRVGPDISVGGREGVGMTITGTLDRTDFGLDTASALVGHSVDIRIELLAHRVEAED